MGYEDILAQARLSGLRLAPDGSRVIVSLARAVDGATRSQLVEIDVASGRVDRGLDPPGAAAASAVYLPDGRLLVAASGAPEAAGLWLDGAESFSRVLPWANPISGLAAADGVAAFVSAVHPGADDATKQRLREAADVQAILYEDLPVRFWDRRVGPREPHLFVSGLGEAPVDVTPDVGAGLVAMQFDIAPDGSCLAAAVRRAEDPTRVSDVVIYARDAAPRVLTADDRAWYDAPRFSPDGRRVMVQRREIGDPRAPSSRALELIDVDGGASRTVGGALASWPAEAAWSPDGRAICCIAQVDGYDALFRVDTRSDEVTALIPDASCSDVQVAADGTVFVLRSTFHAPPEVVRVRDAQATPVWSPHAPRPARERVQRGRAAGPDGSEVPYWLILPEAGSDAPPAPLVVLANAYVPFAWTNRWYFRWNPAAYAAAGYAVLMPDLSPALGYGDAFIARGWGRWTDVSFTDLLTTVDRVGANPRIDATRVGLLGGGWGGWLAAWAAGHTDRFRCIALQGGAWNLPSYLGASDEYDRWEEQLGDPFAERERYVRFSPASAVEQVRTPVLIVAGEQDFRAPAADAIGMFRDLRRQRVDARLLLMPEEGHRIAKLANEKLWYQTLFAFFGHHLRDEPWIRPELL
jgi:dipeptidyl aminopeptidase/acylaminoacyl peptidase